VKQAPPLAPVAPVVKQAPPLAPVAPVVKQAKKVTFDDEPLFKMPTPVAPAVKQAPVVKQAPAVKQAPVPGGFVDLDNKRLQDILAVRKRIADLAALAPEPTPVVLSQEETVIRVPKEFVIQAMELAMKSGKTNIRVEII
jgi:hypothetical protein